MIDKLKQRREQILTRTELIKQQIIHIENQISTYSNQRNQLTNEWLALQGALGEIETLIKEFEVKPEVARIEES